MNIAEKIRTALRRETSMRHVEQHAPLGYGSDFEKCPNVQCRENAELLEGFAAMEAKLSERKTVHEWLNAKGVPKEESGQPICLLRRLSIALGVNG